MMFHVLKFCSSLLLLQHAKKQLILFKRRIFNGMIARLIRLTHIAIYCCIAYIILFGFYFLWVDFDLRNSLPNQLDYENKAWLQIQIVKNNIDGHIKHVFNSLFSFVKFVISELLVIPILFCSVWLLISLSKNKDQLNQSIKKSDEANVSKPKRRIDIAKRNLRSIIKIIDQGTAKANKIKAEQNSISIEQEEKLINDKIKHSQQKIDIMRKNIFVSSAIDNLTDNNIDSELNKIMELEGQRQSPIPSHKKQRRRIDIAQKNLKNFIKNRILK